MNYEDEEDRVGSLTDSTAVDVCHGHDGISDDSIVTDVRKLKAAGFGHLHYEGDGDAPVVWVSRSLFGRIAEAVS